MERPGWYRFGALSQIAMASSDLQKSHGRLRVAAFCRDYRQGGAGRPLLWDGGVGTALIARGLELPREPPESWLLRRPDQVAAVHAAFAAAGADVLQTNSFGLIRLFADASAWPVACGPRPELTALVRQSVLLARQGAAAASQSRSQLHWPAHPPSHSPVPTASPAPIASSSPLPLSLPSSLIEQPPGPAAPAPSDWPEVIGCLGPTGRADLDPARLAALYEDAAAAFVAAGVDVLHLETCLEPRELALALAAVASAAPSLTLLVSITLSMGQSGPETPLGIPLSRLLRELEHAPQPLAAVGVNCSQPARRQHAAVAALHTWSDGRLPVLVQPQVDEPTPDCRFPKKPETPERFARDLLRLRDEGAAALGGCCGATAEHIHAVRQALALDPSDPAGSANPAPEPN